MKKRRSVTTIGIFTLLLCFGLETRAQNFNGAAAGDQQSDLMAKDLQNLMNSQDSMISGRGVGNGGGPLAQEWSQLSIRVLRYLYEDPTFEGLFSDEELGRILSAVRETHVSSKSESMKKSMGDEWKNRPSIIPYLSPPPLPRRFQRLS